MERGLVPQPERPGRAQLGEHGVAEAAMEAARPAAPAPLHPDEREPLLARTLEDDQPVLVDRAGAQLGELRDQPEAERVQRAELEVAERCHAPMIAPGRLRGAGVPSFEGWRITPQVRDASHRYR